jgi:hypothetical protein
VHASEEETTPNVRPKVVFLFPLLGNFLCLSEGYFLLYKGGGGIKPNRRLKILSLSAA